MREASRRPERNRKTTARLLGLVGLLIVLVALVGWRLLSDRTDRVRISRPAVSPAHAVPVDEPGDLVPVPHAAGGPDVAKGTLRNLRGEPVEGATVALLDDNHTIHDRDALAEAGRLVHSDDDGGFVVAWPVAAVRAGLVLSVRHPQYQAAVVRLTSPPGSSVDVVLRDGQVLSGSVVLLDGQPLVRRVRVVARGVAAPYSAARVDRVPPGLAALQETTTDERGAFALHGLPEGWYQLDVLEPGLTVIPEKTMPVGSTDLLFAASRGVVVRTGAAPVEIRVAALAAVAVRVSNARSGHAVLFAYVSLYLPEGFKLVHASPLSMNSEVVLLNGHTYSIDGSDLPQGVQARYAISASYPIPENSRVRVKVIAPGYETLATSFPLVALGHRSGIPIHEIRLKPRLETGSVKFRLADRNGLPVRHVFHLVPELVDGPPPGGAVPVRFDVQGEGEPIALPVGTYVVRVAGSGKWTPVEPVTVDVRPGAVSEAQLTLKDYGGFDLTVVDEDGRPVDNFGVSTALGHQPIKPRVDTQSGSVAFSGLPVLVPGLGDAWRGQVVGYPDGPVTIEVTRHGYRKKRILTEARGGEMIPLRVVLEADQTASPRGK